MDTAWLLSLSSAVAVQRDYIVASWSTTVEPLIPLLFSLSSPNQEQRHLFSLMYENLFCRFFCLMDFSLGNIHVMDVACFWGHFTPGVCVCPRPTQRPVVFALFTVTVAPATLQFLPLPCLFSFKQQQCRNSSSILLWECLEVVRDFLAKFI